MQNFVRIWQIETSVESIDDGQKARTRTLESTNEYNDYVTVRIDMKSMIDAIDDFARALQLFAHAESDFNGQELDELVDQVERREKDQIPYFE